jgi:DNA polymerase-3 subunit epsilon
VLEVDPEPAAGLAVNVGPLKGQALARELRDQLNSLFQLRQCGRKLKLREHPSAYGQMGRCLSPCLGDLDPNLYRRRLDEALGLFDGPGGGERLLGLLDQRMREASAERRYERAAALLRRRERLEWVLARLEGILGAVSGEPRLVLAAHPSKERFDALWIVGGRVADWGPLPGPSELRERTAAALARLPRARAAIPPEEVDEIRIVSAWVAANEPASLALDPAPAAGALERFVARATSARAAAGA